MQYDKYTSQCTHFDVRPTVKANYENRERCERLQAPCVSVAVDFFLSPPEKYIHVYVFTSLFTVRVQQENIFLKRADGIAPMDGDMLQQIVLWQVVKRQLGLEESFTSGNCSIFIELRGRKGKREDEGEKNINKENK